MKYLRILFYFLLIAMFHNCSFHEKFITTTITYSGGIQRECQMKTAKASEDDQNEDSFSADLVFARLYSAFRVPKGLGRFPDGGRAKSQFAIVSLYSYSMGDTEPVHLMDFDLPKYCSLPVRVHLDLQGDLLLVNPKTNTFLYNISTKKKIELGRLGNYARLSHAADRVLYAVDDNFSILDIETLQSQTIFEDRYVRGFSWSLDGKSIYFKDNERKLYRYDLDTEKEQIVDKAEACDRYMGNKRLAGIFRFLPYSFWEHPTPLELNPATFRKYKKDLIRKCGSRHYRYAIMERIILEEGFTSAETMYGKMAEHSKSLDESGKIYYNYYLEEMRQFMDSRKEMGNR